MTTVDDLRCRDDGITHIVARLGYLQRTDIPRMLAALPSESFELPVNLADTSDFLSTIDLHARNAPDISRWRKQLFLATSRLTADAAQALDLPPAR